MYVIAFIKMVWKQGGEGSTWCTALVNLTIMG